MKRAFYVILAGMTLIMAGCGSQPTSDGQLDPYADPGTPPPPPIADPTVRPSFTPSEPDADDLVTLNVAGMDSGDSATRTLDLASDFTVVEDGVVKGITVREIGGGTRAAADIAFVFDTTGSMRSAIDSVKDSIIAFAAALDDSGLDLRIGSVTYGDAFDTLSEGSTLLGTSLAGDEPPSFDREDRPTFELSADIPAFQAFIADQTARGGGTAAENGVGALQFARDNFEWRPGAQCILIVVTDIFAWSDANPGDGIDVDSRWMPPAPADVIEDLAGSCVVHVLAPDYATELQARFFDMALLTGADATGGTFVEFNSRDEFDLSELPISDVLASGYLVTYRATVDGSDHEVRLVVDDGVNRGETTRTLSY